MTQSNSDRLDQIEAILLETARQLETASATIASNARQLETASQLILSNSRAIEAEQAEATYLKPRQIYTSPCHR